MSDEKEYPNNISPISQGRSYRDEWLDKGRKEGFDQGHREGFDQGFRKALSLYHATMARQNDVTLSELNDRWSHVRGEATNAAWREVMGSD